MFNTQFGVEYDYCKGLLENTDIKEMGVLVNGEYKIIYFDFLEKKVGKEVLLN
jgi:hypothetical protein